MSKGIVEHSNDLLKRKVEELEQAESQYHVAQSHLEDVHTELKQMLIDLRGGQFLVVDMGAISRFLYGSEKMKEKPMV
tara:strand:- start:792 stop:1025 length:234 start_codon:yes stop_codon:yes gene_type:complete